MAMAISIAMSMSMAMAISMAMAMSMAMSMSMSNNKLEYESQNVYLSFRRNLLFMSNFVLDSYGVTKVEINWILE